MTTNTKSLPQNPQVIFYPKSSDERWWYVIQVAPRGARVYEGCDLMPSAPITDQQADVQPQEDAPQETPEEDDIANLENVANLADVAELEDDVANLDKNEFSLDGELAMDLQVILELYQDAIDEA